MKKPMIFLCFPVWSCCSSINSFITVQILELLKTALGRDPRHLTAYSDGTHPMGFLQLNAMRLADIFSDDSNFRSYITVYFVSIIINLCSLLLFYFYFFILL